jgi:uncharacterized membrane protein
MIARHLMLLVHLAAVVLWVGGMAFSYLCLRPAAMALPPAQRQTRWSGVLARFFPLVWLALGLIVATGFAMLAATGFAQAPRSWHVMAALGLVMGAVFASIYFGPWRALQRAVAAESWAQGAQALGQIRQRIALNLVLAVLTLACATLGLVLP